MNTKFLAMLVATVISSAACACAQPQPPEGAMPPRMEGQDKVMIFRGTAGQRMPFDRFIPKPHDAMDENFFPPELVMQHQKTIGLKEDQQKAIRAEMSKVTGKVADLQWDLTGARQEMEALAKESKVDEKQAIAQLEKLMGVETEIKRQQVGLLIRIKNILTAEQQARLRELRQQPFDFTAPMGAMERGVPAPLVAPAGNGEIKIERRHIEPKR